MRDFFTTLVALEYSLRRAVRRGVHQGLEWGEDLEVGVTDLIRAVRRLREEENQWSSWGGEGLVGGGGTMNKRSRVSRESQSVSSHLGRGAEGVCEGEANVMTIGTWSEPVEGRKVASQLLKAGNMCGFAKARSMTLGLCSLDRGYRVKTPGVLRRV